MSISATDLEKYKVLLGLASLPLAWSELDLERLGIRSKHSLRRDRVVGGGIPYVKDKGMIRYPVLQVLEWMENNLRHHTSESQRPLRK